MNTADPEIKPPSNFHRRLALAGILGPLIFVLVPQALASSLPGYNPVKDTLSALALTPGGWMQTLDFCIFGILVILFGLGLFTGVTPRRGFKLSLTFLILAGLGILLLSVFPTDPFPKMTICGVVHKYLVYTVGLLFPASCFLMLPSLKADSRWRGLVNFTAITGFLVFLFIIGWIYLNVSGLVNSILGLYERIFTLNAIVWIEVMAVRLLFLPNREPTIRRNIVKVPRYAVIGVSMLLAFSAFQVRKQRRIRRKISFSSMISPVLFFGARNLGDRCGLKPLTDLALNVVKNEE
jgi:hypothetical protein